MRIEDSDTALTLAAGADEAWTSAEGVPMREPRDWRLLYERERARAEAAEARAEELRWAEVAARCDAGSWKSRFEASRRKLKAAVEQAKEAGDAAKNALSLQAEVVRLNKLLSAAGVESSRHSTIMSLRMEVARLRNAAPASEARKRSAAGGSKGRRLILLVTSQAMRYRRAHVGSRRGYWRGFGVGGRGCRGLAASRGAAAGVPVAGLAFAARARTDAGGGGGSALRRTAPI